MGYYSKKGVCHQARTDERIGEFRDEAGVVGKAVLERERIGGEREVEVRRGGKALQEDEYTFERGEFV